MAKYYKRVPVKTPELRVLAQHQNEPGKWAWIKPGDVSDYVPVVRFGDGPYLTVKL